MNHVDRGCIMSIRWRRTSLSGGSNFCGGQSSRVSLVPAAENLGNAPGLSDTSSGSVRRIAIEDLADGSNTRMIEVVNEAVEELPSCLLFTRVDLKPGIYVWADQPGPN